MKKIPAWVWFSLLRLATFVIPLVIMLVIGVPGWIAAIAAAIMGLCLSYIFLAKPRTEVSQSLEKRQHDKVRPGTSDEDVEDAVFDASMPAEAKTSSAKTGTAKTGASKAKPVKTPSRATSRTPAQQKK